MSRQGRPATKQQESSCLHHSSAEITNKPSPPFIYLLFFIFVYLFIIHSFVYSACGCFVCIHVCAPGVCLVPTEARLKKVYDPMELQATVSHNVDAGN